MSVSVQAEYLSVREAGELLGVSHHTIRRRIEAGELPATRLGGAGTSIRIPRSALEAWLWSEGETRAAH